MAGHRNKLIWIEPPLASGGMADVWRVINPGAAGVHNISVVKRILLNYVQNEEFKRMFVDEAKITTQLHKPIPHPNIIQVQKFIEYEDEYLLFLEYVNGQDARRVISKCVKEEIDFPIEYALYIISEALNGLYHAHNLHLEGRNINVIHRDISPQNILISYSGEVKVIDWGIADTEIKTTETVVGVIKGKYGYMSPEQANGDELDYKTDIYSIGVVLWEMVTGRRLFAHKNDLKVLRKIQKSEIDPPKKFNKNISRNLNNIILKALSRKRERRYKDCLEFANELARERNAIAPNFSKVEMAKFLQSTFDEEIKKDQLVVSQAEKQAPSEIPPTARDPKFGRRQRERPKPQKKATNTYEDIVSIGSIKESGVELEDESMVSDAKSLTPTPYGASTGTHSVSEEIDGKPKSVLRRLSFMPILMLVFIILVSLTIVYMKDRGSSIRSSTRKAPVGDNDISVIGNIKIREATGRNLRVVSDIKGFVVRIKGLNYKYIKGESDLFIEDLEPQSSYLVEISKPGFETITKQVQIEADKTVTIPVNNLIAIKEAGNLFVETIPEGAEIYINGIKKDVLTPNTIRLPIKEKYDVKIVRYGYSPEEFKVVLTEGGALIRKKIVLRPQRVAKKIKQVPTELKIYSVPSGAAVYINNRLVCKATPCSYRKGALNETISLEMRLRGYKKYSGNFTLRSESVNVISHSFTKIVKAFGFVSLSSFPDGKIYIDGKYYGKTPVDRLRLKTGKHKIRIIGYKGKKKLTATRYIKVISGKLVKKYFVLK